VSNPYLAKAEQSRKQGVSLLTSGVLIVFHVMAIAAFFTFSWRNLAVALVLHWLAVGLGIKAPDMAGRDDMHDPAGEELRSDCHTRCDE